MSTIPQPTLLEKALVVPNLARAIFSAVLRLCTYPITSGPKASTLCKDVAFAALRTNLALMTLSQEHWLNPTTETVYLDFAKKQNFQPQTDVLASGLKCFWLGSKSAEKVILYFHGGGYVLACSTGHVQWLFSLQEELSKKHSVAVVLVGYTLAPMAQYPAQLKQAAESLNWLVEKEGKKAGDVCSYTLTYRFCGAQEDTEDTRQVVSKADTSIRNRSS